MRGIKIDWGTVTNKILYDSMTIWDESFLPDLVDCLVESDPDSFKAEKEIVINNRKEEARKKEEEERKKEEEERKKEEEERKKEEEILKKEEEKDRKRELKNNLIMKIVIFGGLATIISWNVFVDSVGFWGAVVNIFWMPIVLFILLSPSRSAGKYGWMVAILTVGILVYFFDIQTNSEMQLIAALVLVLGSLLSFCDSSSKEEGWLW